MITVFEKDKIIDAEYEEILEPIYDDMKDEDFNYEYNTEYVQLKRCWISYSRTFWGKLQYYSYKLYDTIADGLLTFVHYLIYKFKMMKKKHKTLYRVCIFNIFMLLLACIEVITYKVYDYQWCESTKECTNVK